MKKKLMTMMMRLLVMLMLAIASELFSSDYVWFWLGGAGWVMSGSVMVLKKMMSGSVMVLKKMMREKEMVLMMNMMYMVVVMNRM